MKIFLSPAVDEESIAVLQSKYIRSHSSMPDLLQELQTTTERPGSCDSYLGECSSTTVFAENVSLVLSAAVAASSGYNGHSTSCRYTDFSSKEIISPLDNPRLRSLQKELQWTYAQLLPRLTSQIRDENLKPDSYTQEKWLEATQKRSFDICHCLLPAGVTTNLSWHSSLRGMRRHLSVLLDHPTQEARHFARHLFSTLGKRYLESFKLPGWKPGATRYYQSPVSGEIPVDYEHYGPSLDGRQSRYLSDLLGRKRFDAIPPVSNLAGGIFEFDLRIDYGSFLYLQRHKGVCTLPILSGDYIHSWYLKQLSAHGSEILAMVSQTMDELHAAARIYPAEELQYYYPIGTVVPVTLQYGLAEAVKVAELRSSVSAPPTLRAAAQYIGRCITETFPELPVHLDLSPDTDLPGA